MEHHQVQTTVRENEQSCCDEHISKRPGPLRPKSIEELPLVPIASRKSYWQAKSPSKLSKMTTPTSESHKNRSSDFEKAKNPYHTPAAGVGTCDNSSVASSTSSTRESSVDSGDDGSRNDIHHTLDSLIKATDATSILQQSSIKFEELKLMDIIGDGKSSKVWKADWRGTPVAVKVLTGEAKANHASTSILDEFAGEINLLNVST